MLFLRLGEIGVVGIVDVNLRDRGTSRALALETDGLKIAVIAGPCSLPLA